MERIDVLGMSLNKGLEVIKEKNYNVKVVDTYGLNKTFTDNLNDPRIIKVIFDDGNIIITVGYF